MPGLPWLPGRDRNTFRHACLPGAEKAQEDRAFPSGTWAGAACPSLIPWHPTAIPGMNRRGERQEGETPAAEERLLSQLSYSYAYWAVGMAGSCIGKYWNNFFSAGDIQTRQLQAAEAGRREDST